MIHLKPQGIKGNKYRYRTADMGDVCEVEVYYRKDRVNMFQGVATERGVWVSIGMLRIEKSESGCISESFGMMSHPSFCALPMARMSDKRLAEIASKVDYVVVDAAEAFQAGNRETAISILRRAVE